MEKRLKLLKIIVLTTLLGLSGQLFAATKAQNFELTDMAGKKHQLSQYAGKWVIVNYWATWCPPCLEEVPDFVALYDSRKNKDVMVIGVALDYESAADVQAYVDDMLMSYPIVLGDEKATAQIGPADVLPTTFIYNPKGQLVKTKRGLVTKQYLENLMAAPEKKALPVKNE